ncbi:aspartate kinase [Peribacillus acanthi]|uniref:aspartate kinase n=1 Tax=Peribacillus acanthi TaxID=2171554 RepID=UPI000D3E696C|nr:aspartate kinase [Peribacillus acanthi]
MKVVKFGGSSLSSGTQIKKVFDIILSDPQRRIIVVSAPGKRFDEDRKVTDLLIDCGIHMRESGQANHQIRLILNRYASIIDELVMDPTMIDDFEAQLLQTLKVNHLPIEKYLDAIKACGEDLNARLIASYFNQRGVKASYVNPLSAGLYVSDEPGNAQVLNESYDNLFKLREYSGILVFPGFFGYTKDKEVVTFSRSGSDITGSILANGVKASMYENFTDVDAVYSVNPTVVEKPKEIRELTYREMRELSYAGFSVFHEEALIPAFKAGIPVNVKNTNNPNAPGTKIVSNRQHTNGPVIGIASDKGFCSIFVSKYLMNREIGFGRKLLQILEENGVSYEHIPSGIDDITVILREDLLDANKETVIIDRINKELDVDDVRVEHGLALIMIVGEGMRHSVGTTARASKALSDVGINIEMINQGSSEVSIMFGIKAIDEHKAVNALYQEFFSPSLIGANV